jgi:hypothetical protein
VEAGETVSLTESAIARISSSVCTDKTLPDRVRGAVGGLRCLFWNVGRSEGGPSLGESGGVICWTVSDGTVRVVTVGGAD